MSINTDTHHITANFTYNQGTDGGPLAVNCHTLDEIVNDIRDFYNDSEYTAEPFTVTNRVETDGEVVVTIKGWEHEVGPSAALGQPFEITVTVTATPHE